MARPKQTKEQITAMRERILDAAAELLHEQGPQALSIRAITKRLGISPMALYTYFENRAALFAALSERHRGRGSQRTPSWANARTTRRTPAPGRDG